MNKTLVREQIIKLRDWEGRAIEAEEDILEKLNVKLHSVSTVEDALPKTETR